MSLSQAMKISSTGLFAERFRLDVISTNIANANSISTPGQEAFRRQMVVLMGDGDGVRVAGTRQDPTELRAVYEPEHPMSDATGHVYYSNVDPVKEMIDMLSATRAYEANIAAFNSAKSMMRSAMGIGQVS